MRLGNIAKQAGLTASQGWKYLLIMMAVGFFALYLGAGEAITIDNLTLGEQLLGEPIVKEDLKDHVVAIEFWGYNCPPCRASIPHMVELVKKYGPKGFILLGIHRQNEPKEKVIGLCKALKVNYPIYASGDVKGISFSGVPHFTIFNHKGAVVFDGHPSEADKKLEETMKNAPDPLVGEGPYNKLKSLAEQIGQHKDFGKIMLQLKKKETSTDADEKGEAEQLIARLNKYAQRMKNRAETLKEKEPLQSYELYQKLNTEFKGDEIGTETEKTLAELKKDEIFQKALKADKDWLKINEMHEGLKPCKVDKPLDIKNCAACQKKNNDILNQINAAGRQLLKQYPETPAAQKVKDLFAELGIELK